MLFPPVGHPRDDADDGHPPPGSPEVAIKKIMSPALGTVILETIAAVSATVYDKFNRPAVGVEVGWTPRAVNIADEKYCQPTGLGSKMLVSPSPNTKRL